MQDKLDLHTLINYDLYIDHMYEIRMRKEILFKDELSKEIQKFADENYERNFNMTVRVLCSAGLKYYSNLKKESKNDNGK